VKPHEARNSSHPVDGSPRTELPVPAAFFDVGFRDGGTNAGERYVIAAGETQAKESDTKLFALQAQDYRWRGRVAVEGRRR
jgi:hypothetical protein